MYQGFPVIREQPEQLIVTVIPLEAHLMPYEISVEFFPDQEKNLKQVFSNDKYWGPIFSDHSPVIPPHFR